MTLWSSRRLEDQHDSSTFDCGVPALNDWLRTQALRAQRSGTARTYVWTAGDSPAVRSYFALAPTMVRRDAVSRSMSGGVSTIPAYLLARLALDRPLHGQRLGAQLLLDALERIVAASAEAGGRLIVVDATDAAAAKFYQHHDFVPVLNDPNRLVMKIATARAALGLP